MRIAVYSDSSLFGGAETSLGHLLAELDAGLDLVVLGIEREVVAELAARRPRARAEVLPAVRTKRDVATFAAHVRALQRLHPDVLHANLTTPASCQYALLAATLVPRVRTVAVEQLPYPLAGRLQRGLKRFTSRRLAAHVAVGEPAAREVERLAGLAAGSVRSIPNGVPDAVLEPLPRPFPGPTIGSVGRLDRQKGYDVLLQALAVLPGAALVLVGDGPEREPLETLARDLGLGGRVRFAGWQAEPRRHLTTFDVFALPSRFEGFPLAIVEAMLAELPVVATAVGSVPEAVREDETGLLVTPDEPAVLAAALGRLLEDPTLRDRLGARGRALALERFTAAAMARSFERLYEEILR
ncbi:MAG TPA: glycosyltransferase [Gaiellaceae bacterium]|nr:glycosyltransferase [Gaiellaceae bacterium]